MWELFWIVLGPAIIMSLTPGPYMLAFSSLAAEGRWKNLAVFWIGTHIAAAVIYYALLYLVGQIPENLGVIFIAMKALAALFFVTVGAMGFMRKVIPADGEEVLETKEEMIEVGFLQLFAAGFLLTLTDPDDLAFVILAVPALANTTDFSFLDMTAVFLSITVADIITLAGYCVPWFFIRRSIDIKYLKYLKYFASTLLIFVGIYLFYNLLRYEGLKETGLL